MSTATWVVLYLLQALWWLWLARWGGARRVEGWLATLLLHPVAWKWDAELIRLFAWISLAATTAWFVLGLVEPAARAVAP